MNTHSEPAREAGFFVPIECLRIRALTPNRWALVEPFIERALAHANGTHHASDVRLAILGGEAQLWVVFEGDAPLATLVTEIEDYPRKRVLRLWLAAGERAREWVGPVSDRLREYAVEQRCDLMMLHGRPGWERLLRGRAMVRESVMVQEVSQ